MLAMPFFATPLFQVGVGQQLLVFTLGSAVIYLTIRSVWRIYFHPLSRYPGPKIAAVSDIWYAYHSLKGRWPWAAEAAIRKYGNVVRIAPNELVFASPRALADIYGSHNKNLELFTKTQINNHGNDEHGGIIWEWDPARHRQVAKQLSPAFSGRALRAKEPTLHKYIDLFIERMKRFGGEAEGVMKEPPYLTILQGFNKAVVVIQASWRFPLLSPLKYPFLLTTAIKSHSHIRDHSRQQLERRIRRKGAVEHLDFFEQFIPDDREPPKNRKDMRHLEQVAGQLLIAGYEPPALWIYYTIYYLLKSPSVLDTLVKEVRGAFVSHNGITSDVAATLPYLTACLKESLRMMPNLLTGMPVISPGAMVDGIFIPKGVVCQSSPFALARSSSNFKDPLDFRPERWLPKEHGLYDGRFHGDNFKGFHPFGQGPRMCAGKEIAWWQSRVFMAKILWVFDLQMVPGQQVNVDRDLRGWGIYQKPDVRLRFVPIER
ncbi:cytochrome P450 [Annulohypoxylon stygium]|nr:cytochrome P450 [Annulohypoxylon stygium]